MKYRKILVPFDGSEASRHALDTAEDIAAGADGAQVVVLNVIASSDVNPKFGKDNPFWSSADLMGYDEYKKFMVSAIDGARKALLEALADDVARMGDALHADVVASPSAARGIASYVKDNGVDLVVMGRRGLGAIRGMLGSVSYSVLGEVDVPVLTVR